MGLLILNIQNIPILGGKPVTCESPMYTNELVFVDLYRALLHYQSKLFHIFEIQAYMFVNMTKKMINISTCTRVLACNWEGLKIEKKEDAEVFLSRQIYIDIKLII